MESELFLLTIQSLPVYFSPSCQISIDFLIIYAASRVDAVVGGLLQIIYQIAEKAISQIDLPE